MGLTISGLTASRKCAFGWFLFFQDRRQTKKIRQENLKSKEKDKTRKKIFLRISDFPTSLEGSRSISQLQ